MRLWRTDPNRGLSLAETMTDIAEDLAIAAYLRRHGLVAVLAAAAARADAMARLDSALRQES